MTCHDSVMFCLFAYIFKILYSSRVTLPLNLSEPIFKISKNGAKQFLKGKEGIFRMDVVKRTLLSFVFPCLVENIWSVGGA